MSALAEGRSDFVRSLTTAITRRVDRYVDLIDGARERGDLRGAESDLLDQFEQYTGEVLDHFTPPGVRSRDSLVFAHLYAAERDAEADDRAQALLVALMAADVEMRGPLQLSQNQRSRLAELFGHLGARLADEGLLRHAALAFERAAALYVGTGDHRARDRCLLEQARARRLVRDFGWAKVQDTLSLALCGFGYKPYRLLGWMAAQLVLFTALVWLIGGAAFGTTLHLVLTGFLNPAGPDDTAALADPAGALLVLESYLGALSVSVFFALLVRRWFRA